MSSIKVLVAQPVNPNVNLELWEKNANSIYASLTFGNKTQGLFKEKVSREGGKWARTSRSRQMLIDEYLNEDHTHVLWIDADVVDIDPDIIEKLLNISQDSVVAPYVFLEDNNYWPYKRFYDLSCFIDANGEEFNYFPLYNRDSRDKKAEVESVGTCFLAPAHIHRSIKYDPFSEEIEHVNFFSKARAKGIKIYADPSIEIRHAFLPKYGESFH
tara:strand:- start:103 stop:744 length:642 start_codon:yes stop_codon:yes gene_type:complete